MSGICQRVGARRDIVLEMGLEVERKSAGIKLLMNVVSFRLN